MRALIVQRFEVTRGFRVANRTNDLVPVRQGFACKGESETAAYTGDEKGLAGHG